MPPGQARDDARARSVRLEHRGHLHPGLPGHGPGGLPRLKLDRSGLALLGAIIAVAGALSAVFSNDIICLAMTPVVAQLCLQRRVNLVPFLLGLLALVSALAGNLLLVGSIANLIVADLAQKSGITIDWRMHARVGVPVTVLTLAVLWALRVWL